uniref:C2 domain-containing protein n=1 Tax=Wuchereria bancrofti TaxID=6293 RepID=A0AAF5RV18_WUCBA
MRLSFGILLWCIFTFCHILSAQFWTNVKLEELKWSNDCDLRNICIQPTLQLRLINILNNETISKTLNVNFDKQQTGETHLISYWSEGTPDMIISTITINGIDPDYDFTRLCDSTGTIFLFRLAQMKNMTEMSGMCFKAQLTFTKYSDQCLHMINSTTVSNGSIWRKILSFINYEQ